MSINENNHAEDSTIHFHDAHFQRAAFREKVKILCNRRMCSSLALSVCMPVCVIYRETLHLVTFSFWFLIYRIIYKEIAQEAMK